MREVSRRRAALALALLLNACGGGGSDGTSPPPGSRTVALQANTSVTPWTSGTLALTVSPPPADGETMQCRIDTAPAQDCSEGRVAYAGLERASHTLTVTIEGPQGSRSHELAWRIAMPDIVVYGGTPGGLVAAIAAGRMGKTVVVIEPTAWIGGMMTGGLAKTDVGGSRGISIGGIAREFFDRTRARESATGACPNDSACPAYFDFEPHVAGWTFATMLAEIESISIQRGLDITGVVRSGARVTAVDTPLGPLEAQVFIDASYEGDLAVRAGATSTSGREARLAADSSSSSYGLVEDDAGVGTFVLPYGIEIDPYVIPGQSASGRIAFVQPEPSPTPPPGSADTLVMAYNQRLCVTDDPSNRVPFSKPADFDPARYEGSARIAVATAARGDTPLDELYFNPARTVRSRDRDYYKHDLNGGSAFSTDMSLPEWNQAYTSAAPAQRAEIVQAYRSYIQGLLYFWQTDPRFGALNQKVARFGLCADEFVDNDHWPYRLYARETRRMVGEYVMNENDLLQNGRRVPLADSIGQGAYSMDRHLRRIVVSTSLVNGVRREWVRSEGFGSIDLPGYTPYPIAYRSLTPLRTELENLLNPVTPSSTALAFSSMRMEPTFMILGQAAGTAAAMAIDTGRPVQDVDVPALQSKLRAGGQVL